MSSNESRRGRRANWLVALTTVAGAFAALAAPAAASSGQGTVAINLANHSKGRTLSGQGVTILAGAPATKQGQALTLPVTDVDPVAAATATAEGSLNFKHGKQSLSLTALRLELATGSLTGKLDGEQLPVFRLGAVWSVNSTTGAVSLSGGKLRLTPEAATALKESFGLKRALAHKGVGMIWLAAQANPTHAPAQAVTSGTTNWGVLASWRKYVLGNFGPGSIGAITPAEGATSTGNLAEPSSFIGFPAAGGSFQKGLYGAADKLALKTAGSVTFAKPGHCIVEVKFSGLEVALNGANSSLTLDSAYDVDTPAGMTCADAGPAITAADVNFATLNLSGVTPSYSAGGKTVTWSAIPAALTAAGSTAFLGGKYPAGQVLDPVTISVGIG